MNTRQIDAELSTQPIDLLEHNLRRLMWIEQKRMGQLLAEHNLTVPQFFALVNLAHHEDGVAMGDLASRLSQSNATMSGIIDRLQLVGLVERKEREDSDRRKIKVQLTPKGRGLLERAKSTRRASFQRALAKFPARDITAFVRLLDAYLGELEKDS